MYRVSLVGQARTVIKTCTISFSYNKQLGFGGDKVRKLYSSGQDDDMLEKIKGVGGAGALWSMVISLAVPAGLGERANPAVKS